MMRSGLPSVAVAKTTAAPIPRATIAIESQAAKEVARKSFISEVLPVRHEAVGDEFVEEGR